jgi:ubiquinone/menaquinone biosynthesis C-methylase UbiE
LTKKNHNKKIRFVAGNIKFLPFKNQTFDFIVCFETIEHLKKEEGLKALLEFKRVLKKNGFLLISSPNAQLTRLKKKLFRSITTLHLHEYEPEELKNFLAKMKMKVVAAKGQYLFFPPAYLFPRFFSFLKFLFLPFRFFPLCLSRYFVFIAKKIETPRA